MSLFPLSRGTPWERAGVRVALELTGVDRTTMAHQPRAPLDPVLLSRARAPRHELAKDLNGMACA
jgi:hypothetical protein